MVDIRIGQGFDVHQLVEQRPLILGGVSIPFEKGLAGHSDADVLLHAICDALLGALALGDIGQHFPDTDPHYKDADSKVLLRHVNALVNDKEHEIVNLDCTVMAQAPKLAPYIMQIRETVAMLLDTKVSRISIKATTTEKLGFAGRGEGIAAQTIVLLRRKPYYDQRPK